MTPDQIKQLSELLTSKRIDAGLSGAEVARRAGVDVGTVSRIERGQIASPTAKTLLAMGKVLGISATELFAIAPWTTPQELPTIRPYLRTKYHLPDEAMREIEAHFADVAKRHGISFDPNDGPVDGEDE
ncbi:helix-turn-helix transcriptional regulator [Mycobacterium sp.]|uniref:helix-turn-helix domain-containing protein n=1 Tax=Mycobacterium sp. TaxID=1785 RepID=UPI002B5C73FD|nr:helix-turn-helix transcriptional regulator [Mycobacterium sp.]HKP39460.1 helix-turn-helix transcriptional regulator [Mycobacterium sp.]